MSDLQAAKARAKINNLMQIQLRAQQQQLDELRKMQMTNQSDRILQSPSTRGLINISSGGKALGPLSITEVRKMINDGSISLEDHYYDTICNDWIELAGHAMLNPA